MSPSPYGAEPRRVLSFSVRIESTMLAGYSIYHSQGEPQHALQLCSAHFLLLLFWSAASSILPGAGSAGEQLFLHHCGGTFLHLPDDGERRSLALMLGR